MNYLIYLYKLSKRLNFFDLVKLLFTKNRKEIIVRLSGKKIKIRKGSPDLAVAISCFSGEFDILKFLFPKDYDGVIIDAGSYIGTSAIALSELYPKAKILGLEASSENYRFSIYNTREYKNISIINKALSHENTKTKVFDRSTEQWGYTIIEQAEDSEKTFPLNTVETVNLKSLGYNINDIGLIKMDIEGAERDIFLHDYNSLSKIPFIFVELHDRIISDCSNVFFKFSENRAVVNDGNEKYLSIKLYN